MKQLRNYKGGQERPQFDNKTNETFESMKQKYAGFSEDALLEQLVEKVKSAKKNGTYNKAQMDTYINMLQGHLSKAQLEKLDNILRIIETEY